MKPEYLEDNDRVVPWKTVIIGLILVIMLSIVVAMISFTIGEKVEDKTLNLFQQETHSSPALSGFGF